MVQGLDRSPDNALQRCMYLMELERVRFALRCYYRTRLRKVRGAGPAARCACCQR